MYVFVTDYLILVCRMASKMVVRTSKMYFIYFYADIPRVILHFFGKFQRTHRNLRILVLASSHYSDIKTLKRHQQFSWRRV